MTRMTADEISVPLLSFDTEGIMYSAQTQRQWVAVQNLDAFFQKIYEYFEERGFWRMVMSRITNLLILAFTILFSTFLLLFVDWNEILSCHSKKTCAKIIGVRPGILSELSPAEVLVVSYFAVFCLYWLWNLISFLHCLRDGLEMRSFYITRLDISDDALQTMEWDDIVVRLEELQKVLKISIVKDHDALDITNRILRKDNYFIAMVNRGILDLSIPFLTKELHIGPILGKSLEWNIRFCVLNSMFDDEPCTVRSSFLDEPEQLRRLFITMAIANFILMPFTLLFMIIFFFLKNAEELHSRRSYLGPRQWSTIAEWTFREFNEVPHVFRARLNESHTDALAYISQFPAPVISILAQFVAYMSGAIVAVLLILTASDSSLMVDIQILGHSLLYYLFVFTALLAACRSVIATHRPNMDFGVLMNNVFRHTHYMPPLWKHQPQSSAVRVQFSKLYVFKLVAFLQELLCVVTAPLVLGFTLPATASRLTEFVRAHTVRREGVGDICSFAVYDFDSDSEHNRFSVHQATGRQKMEKSLVSFSTTHPSWKPDRNGAAILHHLAERSDSNLPYRHSFRGEVWAADTRHRQTANDEDTDLSESTQALAINVSDIMFHGGTRSAANRMDVQSALLQSIVLNE